MCAKLLRMFIVAALATTGYRVVDARHVAMANEALANGQLAAFIDGLEQQHAHDAADDGIFLAWLRF